MTVDRAALLALASRVEQLIAPSREVDAEVWCALKGGIPIADIGINGKPAWTGCVWPGETAHAQLRAENLGDMFMTPPLTASLDAAMALKDELLPGMTATLIAYADGMAWCEIRPHGADSGDWRDWIRCRAHSAPCALVAAVLRAVAAKLEAA